MTFNVTAPRDPSKVIITDPNNNESITAERSIAESVLNAHREELETARKLDQSQKALYHEAWIRCLEAGINKPGTDPK